MTGMTEPSLPQEQLEDLALTWAREQLAAAPLIRLHQLAAARGLRVESADQVELDQLIGRLQVVLPDPKAPKAYRTDIPGRSPRTKSHMNLGTARAAVGYQWGYNRTRGGKIYELTDTGWKLLHDITPGTPPADLPWRKK